MGPRLFASMSAASVTVPKGQIRSLAEAWQTRHEGIPAAPKMANVGAVRHSPCKLGVCVCGAQNLTRRVCTNVATALKELDQDDIVAGSIVLRWTSASYVHVDSEIAASLPDDVDEDMQTQLGFEKIVEESYTHIATTSLRPFRPILLEVTPASTDRLAVGVLPFEVVEDAQHRPKLFTLYEWCQQRLCPSKIWDMAAFSLSTRRAPISTFRGHAYVVVSEVLLAKQVWRGGQETVASQRRRRPVPFHKQRIPDVRGSQSASSRSAEAAPAPDEEDGGGADKVWDELEAASGAEDATDPIAELVQAAASTEPRATRARRAASSSSSTSSSSSGSDTSKRSSSCSSEERYPALHAKGMRKIRGKLSWKWKTCRFTWRPAVTRGGRTSNTSWQATCPYHGDVQPDGVTLQTACTRSRKVGGGDMSGADSLGVIDVLQDWLIRGPDFSCKADHQKAGDKKRSAAERSSDVVLPDPKQCRRLTPVQPKAKPGPAP